MFKSERKARLNNTSTDYLPSFHLFTAISMHENKFDDRQRICSTQYERLNKKAHSIKTGIEPASFNNRLAGLHCQKKGGNKNPCRFGEQ